MEGNETENNGGPKPDTVADGTAGGSNALNIISVQLPGTSWERVLKTHFQVLEDAAIFDVYACLGKRECDPSSSGLQVEFSPSSAGTVLTLKQAKSALETHFISSQQDRLREYTYDNVMQMYNLFREDDIDPSEVRDDASCEFRSHSLRFRGDWTSILLQRRCDFIEAFCMDVSRHLGLLPADIRDIRLLQQEATIELEVTFVLRIPNFLAVLEDCAESLSECRYGRVWSMYFEAYPSQIPHDLHFRFLGEHWEPLLEVYTSEFEEAALEDVNRAIGDPEEAAALGVATMFIMSKESAHLLCKFTWCADSIRDSVGQRLEACTFENVWGLYRQLSNISTVIVGPLNLLESNSTENFIENQSRLLEDGSSREGLHGAECQASEGSSCASEGGGDKEHVDFPGEGWKKVLQKVHQGVELAALADITNAFEREMVPLPPEVKETTIHFSARREAVTMLFPRFSSGDSEESQTKSREILRNADYTNLWKVYNLYSNGAPCDTNLIAVMPSHPFSGDWGKIAKHCYGSLHEAFCEDVAKYICCKPSDVHHLSFLETPSFEATFSLPARVSRANLISQTDDGTICELRGCRYPRTWFLYYKEVPKPDSMHVASFAGDKWLGLLDTNPSRLEEAASKDVKDALEFQDSSAPCSKLFFSASSSMAQLHTIFLPSSVAELQTSKGKLSKSTYPTLMGIYQESSSAQVENHPMPIYMQEEDIDEDAPPLQLVDNHLCASEGAPSSASHRAVSPVDHQETGVPDPQVVLTVPQHRIELGGMNSSASSGSQVLENENGEDVTNAHHAPTQERESNMDGEESSERMNEAHKADVADGGGVPSGNIIRHMNIRLAGNLWKTVLENLQKELYEAFRQDVRDACGPTGSSLEQVQFTIGSLNCAFDIECPESVTEEQLMERLKGHGFPEVWKLYSEWVGDQNDVPSKRQILSSSRHGSVVGLSSYIHEEGKLFSSSTSSVPPEFEEEESCPSLTYENGLYHKGTEEPPPRSQERYNGEAVTSPEKHRVMRPFRQGWLQDDVEDEESALYFNTDPEEEHEPDNNHSLHSWTGAGPLPHRGAESEALRVNVLGVKESVLYFEESFSSFSVREAGSTHPDYHVAPGNENIMSFEGSPTASRALAPLAVYEEQLPNLYVEEEESPRRAALVSSSESGAKETPSTPLASERGEEEAEQEKTEKSTTTEEEKPSEPSTRQSTPAVEEEKEQEAQPSEPSSRESTPPLEEEKPSEPSTRQSTPAVEEEEEQEAQPSEPSSRESTPPLEEEKPSEPSTRQSTPPVEEEKAKYSASSTRESTPPTPDERESSGVPTPKAEPTPLPPVPPKEVCDACTSTGEMEDSTAPPPSSPPAPEKVDRATSCESLPPEPAPRTPTPLEPERDPTPTPPRTPTPEEFDTDSEEEAPADTIPPEWAPEPESEPEPAAVPQVTKVDGCTSPIVSTPRERTLSRSSVAPSSHRSSKSVSVKQSPEREQPLSEGPHPPAVPKPEGVRMRVGFHGTHWQAVLQKHHENFIGVFVSEVAEMLQCYYIAIEDLEVTAEKGVVANFRVKVQGKSSAALKKLRSAPFPKVWELYDSIASTFVNSEEEEGEGESSECLPHKTSPAAVPQPEPITRTHLIYFEGRRWNHVVDNQWTQFEKAFLNDTHNALRRPLQDIRIEEVKYEDKGMSVKFNVTALKPVRTSSRPLVPDKRMLTPTKFSQVKALYEKQHIKHHESPQHGPKKPSRLQPMPNTSTTSKSSTGNRGAAKKNTNKSAKESTSPTRAVQNPRRRKPSQQAPPPQHTHDHDGVRCNTCEGVYTSVPRTRSVSTTGSSYLRPTCSYLQQTAGAE